MKDLTNSFKQAIINKARVDKFVMVMNMPEALLPIVKESLTPETIQDKALFFAVSGAGVPKQEVPSAKARYSGQTMKLSSHSRPEWSDSVVKMTVDNLFSNYWVIDRWLNLLNDQYHSYYDVKNYSDLPGILGYTANFSIYALDEFDQALVEFRYIRCFPTSIGEITYDYTESGELVCPISFAYSQFLTEPLWNK